MIFSLISFDVGCANANTFFLFTLHYIVYVKSSCYKKKINGYERLQEMHPIAKKRDFIKENFGGSAAKLYEHLLDISEFYHNMRNMEANGIESEDALMPHFRERLYMYRGRDNTPENWKNWNRKIVEYYSDFENKIRQRSELCADTEPILAHLKGGMRDCGIVFPKTTISKLKGGHAMGSDNTSMRVNPGRNEEVK